MTQPSSDQALHVAANMFHEIVAALTAEDLIAASRGPALMVARDKLRDNLRSRDQLKKIAVDGFELCVRALAAMGAPDVTIHECGESALGEQPWSGGDD